MKSIVFIIPYFGHFNNYFEVWLNSCAHNPTVDWLIFTDCKDEYNYPKNVKVVYITFADIRARFQSFYDFPISLEKPYKLCDFRPAYGEIFYEYIKDYDFWGYCDTDLVWGNLRRFFAEPVLNTYDKIGLWGHCCLMRNNERMRTIYKQNNSGGVTYVEAFSSKLAYCFDEIRGFGKICDYNGVKSFDNYSFFDIDYRYDDYRISHLDEAYIKRFNVNAHNIFEYDNGTLFLLSVDVDGDHIDRKEISYVHFQKRKMGIGIERPEYNHFLVYKNKFAPFIQVKDVDTIRMLDAKSCKKSIYLKILWQKIKAEFLHMGGVRYYKYDY